MNFLIDIKQDILVLGKNKRVSFFRFLNLLIFDTGFFAVFMYRVYSRLYKKNFILKLLAKILWRINVAISGCYLQPQSSIKGGLCLPHPIGVVVGEGVLIGRSVRIYQSVTLGKCRDGSYPIIKDNVVIYASSTIIGNAIIGENTIVGANSFINKSCQSNSVLAGSPARNILKP